MVNNDNIDSLTKLLRFSLNKIIKNAADTSGEASNNIPISFNNDADFSKFVFIMLQVLLIVKFCRSVLSRGHHLIIQTGVFTSFLLINKLEKSVLNILIGKIYLIPTLFQKIFK